MRYTAQKNPDSVHALMLRIFLLISLFFLCACGTPKKQCSTLLPMPLAQNDPTNEQLITAMTEHIKTIGAPAATRYQIARIDLNHDGFREGIIFIDGPYGYWCGAHGCTMKIFHAHPGTFTYLNTIKPVRSPIYVSTLETNGWSNLIVRVSGRAQSAKNVMLKYNGRNYPENPEQAAPYSVSLENNPSHTRLFNRY